MLLTSPRTKRFVLSANQTPRLPTNSKQSLRIRAQILPACSRAREERANRAVAELEAELERLQRGRQEILDELAVLSENLLQVGPAPLSD
jgi:uncharacterized membrane protein YccC